MGAPVFTACRRDTMTLVVRFRCYPIDINAVMDELIGHIDAPIR